MSNYILVNPAGNTETLEHLPATRKEALELLQTQTNEKPGTYQFQEMISTDNRYGDIDLTLFSFTRYEAGEWGLSQWLPDTPIEPLRNDVILYATDIKPLLGNMPAYAELGGDAEYTHLWLEFFTQNAESVARFTIEPCEPDLCLSSIENLRDLHDGIPIATIDTRSALLVAELIAQCWLGHPHVCLRTGALNQGSSKLLLNTP